MRDDDLRSQSGYALDRGRAENAAGGARAWEPRTPSSCRPHSWARTRSRSNTANAGAKVDLIIGEMIPSSREGLAEWCDVFCETGLHAARVTRDPRSRARRRLSRGSTPTSSRQRCPEGAAEVRARSADHLIFADETAADQLAAAGRRHATADAVLPETGRFAPARMLIERGVAVALATDVNPGAGYSPSMPFGSARLFKDLTFEEALVGATINAACSLDRRDRIGSLGRGADDAVASIDPRSI
jgi:imidazolonepropionase